MTAPRPFTFPVWDNAPERPERHRIVCSKCLDTIGRAHRVGEAWAAMDTEGEPVGTEPPGRRYADAQRILWEAHAGDNGCAGMVSS